jgi:glycosyltransferase involved in cell wall biosynthesis
LKLAKILFVEQFYYPDDWGGAELPQDLTQYLQSRGHLVTVLCGSDQYVPVSGDPGPDPAGQGVSILRVPKFPGIDVRKFKAARQVFFYVHAIRHLLLRKPPDLFVAQTNPPLIVVLIAFAARLWRRPLLIITQDLYPEILVAHGTIARLSLVTRALTSVFAWAYRRARKVVSIGSSMTLRLREKGVSADRIVAISNWSTGARRALRREENLLRTEWRLESRCVVLYSGNVGIGHEFDTLLDGLLLAVGNHTELTLLVIGQGARLGELRAGVARRNLQSNVMFKDFVSADRLPESIGLAAIAVVTLRQGFEGLIVPSKLLGYMSRAVPVLYIGPDADTSELIEVAQCGKSCRSGDAKAVAAVLAEAASNPEAFMAMGERGRSYYDRHLTREIGLARFHDVVESCLRT